MNLIGKDNATSESARQAFPKLGYSARVHPNRIRAALISCLASFVLTSAEGQSVERETALLNPRAVALNPATGDVYAVAPWEDAVMVLRAGETRTRRIGVGHRPVALAVNAKTNRIYVANNESGSISVLDGSAGTVAATLDVGANPYELAVDTASNKILVSNTFSDVITVIDGATNSLSRRKAGSADAIEVDENTGEVLLLGYENENLSALNATSGAVSKVKVGIHQWGMALDRERRAIYLTMSGSAELAIIDQKSGEVRKVATGETPCALVLNPMTATLYIVNHTGDSVTVVNAAHRIVIATVAVGHQPQGIALDAKRNRIYVANRGDSSVSVIDGARNKVVKTVPVAGNPFALAVEPGSGRLYATTLNNPLVVAIP